MRVRFEWTADEPLELPVNYHQILQGIIYRNIQNEYGYSSFLHDEGYTYGQRRYRLFCFSDIRGEGTVKNKKITFIGPLSFEVSSPENYLIRTLEDNVSREGFMFEDHSFTHISINLSDFEVESRHLTVRALSPITVYETNDQTGKTRYFSPTDSEFEEEMNYNFQRKYEAYYGIPVTEMLQIKPIKVNDRDKCVTTYKGIYITGYYGIYSLEGPRKYLNFLYQTGLGAKNSQGFGMIAALREPKK